MHLKDFIKLQFLEVVEDQLRKNDPPETADTLARLIGQGYTSEQAKMLISTCVSTELIDAIGSEHIADSTRYLQNLKRLPELPATEGIGKSDI